MKIQFYLRYFTRFGQSLWISDNSIDDASQLEEEAIPMIYLNDEFWTASIEIEDNLVTAFQYKYILRNENGEIVPEWGHDRKINILPAHTISIQLIDTWCDAGKYENSFYTAPFKDVLMHHKKKKSATKDEHRFTHVFKIKAPLLKKDETVCLLGSSLYLNNWNEENPVLLEKEDNWYTVKIDLSGESFPIAYKYGVYNLKEEKFTRYETGDNRLLYDHAPDNKIIFLHDGFIHLPNTTWKGAGVAVPVFSLRSKSGFGTGEFTDIKLLVDWAKKTGLKLIQILPVNDTTVSHTWKDSYPYAAISAFALHPLYINLELVAGKKQADKLKLLQKKQKQLNELTEVDYETVINFKLTALQVFFKADGKETLEEKSFLDFYTRNQHWLVPYAAFCYLRDKYGTAQFQQWETHREYNPEEITRLTKNKKEGEEIRFHYFVQYHLHLQLKEAADYAHKHGIIIKGDIPIGISRYGCDAWVAPELYNMNLQAGAPPDDFAIKGQNWGFPTYNWKKMQEDHFDWWRKRFEQMSSYFDAFRIDHILGFFRIWSIPEHAVEGIMGHFVPAIPVSIHELGERGIWFDKKRYCDPYITDDVLKELKGDETDEFRKDYLVRNGFGGYDLKPEFNTQQKVAAYFEIPGNTDKIKQDKQVLFNLLSNVLFLEEEGSEGEQFHFRIEMDKTISFRHLDWSVQQKLKELYVDYFFKRQDDTWEKEAMHKLPYLKKATNMLICGEDLGMVPHCVPDVMKQLGILSLEIQRMPKDPETEFLHPRDVPYLSVITPSTHDMSTIRGWWEEDREKIQRFYTQILGQRGSAPYFCEAWINRAIVLQHLYSPAMWSIFQIQDLLGMSEEIRRENPQEERINIPADPNHYWRYRMHITLEQLIKENDFNKELADYIKNSERS